MSWTDHHTVAIENKLLEVRCLRNKALGCNSIKWANTGLVDRESAQPRQRTRDKVGEYRGELGCACADVDTANEAAGFRFVDPSRYVTSRREREVLDQAESNVDPANKGAEAAEPLVSKCLSSLENCLGCATARDCNVHRYQLPSWVTNRDQTVSVDSERLLFPMTLKRALKVVNGRQWFKATTGDGARRGIKLDRNSSARYAALVARFLALYSSPSGLLEMITGGTSECFLLGPRSTSPTASIRHFSALRH